MVIQQGIVNKIRLNVSTDIETPYFLVVFTNLTACKTVSVIFENQNTDCNFYLINIDEITGYEEDEDLENGIVKLSPSGTWSYDLFAQASSTNTDITEAEFLESGTAQVMLNADTSIDFNEEDFNIEDFG